MTAAWSKGCRRHYPCYFCMSRGCEAKSKAVPRAEIEAGFADILKTLQPSPELFKLAKAMFRDAWDMRLSQTEAQRMEWQSQLKATEKQIEELLDRIVDAKSNSVVAAYEKRIDKLESEKIVLAERASKSVPPKGRLEECIELTLKFLSTPCKIYEKGDFALRQTVLRLAFWEPLRYHPEGGYRNHNFAFPFKALEGFSIPKSEMVLRGRIELPTSSLPMTRSTTELPQHP